MGVLDCGAAGEPRPKITWLRNGIILETGTRYLLDGSVSRTKHRKDSAIVARFRRLKSSMRIASTPAFTSVKRSTKRAATSRRTLWKLSVRVGLIDAITEYDLSTKGGPVSTLCKCAKSYLNSMPEPSACRNSKCHSRSTWIKRPANPTHAVKLYRANPCNVLRPVRYGTPKFRPYSF